LLKSWKLSLAAAAGLVLVLFLVSGIFSGCGAPGAESHKGNGVIQVRGSDSEVNLVQRMAEEYMDDNPGLQIAVTGGGSGTGIAALIDGTIDIANSSRPMKEEEVEEARANNIEPVPVRFAVDALAVIVNESNPLDELSVEEIGAIFRGDIIRWSELGGEDKEISLYGRQSNSGTYVFFMEEVLQGDYSTAMRNMGGNADIVEAISTDVEGIGYVAFGYALEGDGVRRGLKVLNVSESGEAASPLEPENIIAGTYPISRPLYQYLNGQPEGVIRDFIQFELSERGEEIVSMEGFYPLRTEDLEANRQTLDF